MQRLRADEGVQAVVGPRVYERQGPYGGVAKEIAPEAFDADGDLLPSLVVQMETRTTRAQSLGRDRIAATQTIAVFAVAERGYEAQEQALRAVLACLHNLRGLRPVHDTHMAVAEIQWAEDTGALIDEALGVPMLASRFAAAITQTINPGA